MRRFGVGVALLMLLVAPSVSLPAVAQGCTSGETLAFRDAFAQLKADLGPLMGEPASCWYVRPGHEAVFQDTTTGLAYHWPAVWLTVFTDGHRHWAMTTHGPAYWEGPEATVPERTCGWNPGGEPAIPRLGAFPGVEPPSYWTVVVGSFDTREEAELLGGRLCLAGLKDLDILSSSHYGSLRPGYWVTRAGQFPDRARAAIAAEHIQLLGFDGAYPRELRR